MYGISVYLIISRWNMKMSLLYRHMHCCCSIWRHGSIQCLRSNSFAHFKSIQSIQISHYDWTLMLLHKVNVVWAKCHKSNLCREIMAWVKQRLRILRCNTVDCLNYEMVFLVKFILANFAYDLLIHTMRFESFSFITKCQSHFCLQYKVYTLKYLL